MVRAALHLVRTVPTEGYGVFVLPVLGLGRKRDFKLRLREQGGDLTLVSLGDE